MPTNITTCVGIYCTNPHKIVIYAGTTCMDCK